MVFSFKKIRETINAYKVSKELEDQDQFYQVPEYRIADAPPKTKAIIRIIVITIVMFPFMWLAEWILRSCGTATGAGVSAIILTAFYTLLYTVFIDRIRDKVVQKIPFYKLNPYFGNKLEETIRAFKKPTNR